MPTVLTQEEFDKFQKWKAAKAEPTSGVKPLADSAPISFGKSALKSIIPAAGAVGAAALTGGTSLLPTIGAALLGGFGTGLAQEGVMRAVENDETTAKRIEQERLNRQQHPYATILGEIVGSIPAGGVTPANMIRGALRGNTKDLSMMAIGSTLPTGIETASQYLTDTYEPERLLPTAIGGMLTMGKSPLDRLFTPKVKPPVPEGPIEPQIVTDEKVLNATLKGVAEKEKDVLRSFEDPLKQLAAEQAKLKEVEARYKKGIEEYEKLKAVEEQEAAAKMVEREAALLEQERIDKLQEQKRPSRPPAEPEAEIINPKIYTTDKITLQQDDPNLVVPKDAVPPSTAEQNILAPERVTLGPEEARLVKPASEISNKRETINLLPKRFKATVEDVPTTKTEAPVEPTVTPKVETPTVTPKVEETPAEPAVPPGRVYAIVEHIEQPDGTTTPKIKITSGSFRDAHKARLLFQEKSPFKVTIESAAKTVDPKTGISKYGDLKPLTAETSPPPAEPIVAKDVVPLPVKKEEPGLVKEGKKWVAKQEELPLTTEAPAKAPLEIADLTLKASQPKMAAPEAPAKKLAKEKLRAHALKREAELSGAVKSVSRATTEDLIGIAKNPKDPFFKAALRELGARGVNEKDITKGVDDPTPITDAIDDIRLEMIGKLPPVSVAPEVKNTAPKSPAESVITLYHGGTLSGKRDIGTLGKALYTTPNIQVAQTYARKTGKVFEVLFNAKAKGIIDIEKKYTLEELEKLGFSAATKLDDQGLYQKGLTGKQFIDEVQKTQSLLSAGIRAGIRKDDTGNIKEVAIYDPSIAATAKPVKSGGIGGGIAKAIDKNKEGGFIDIGPVYAKAEEIFKEVKTFAEFTARLVAHFGKAVAKQAKDIWDYLSIRNSTRPVKDPYARENKLIVRFMAPITDRIATLGPTHKYVSGQLKKLLYSYQSKANGWANDMLLPLNTLTNDEAIKVYNTLLDEAYSLDSLRNTLSKKEQVAYDAIRGTLKKMHEDQRKSGQPVIEIDPETGKRTPRLPMDNPYYMFMTLNKDVANTYAKNPEGEKAKALDKIYTDYLYSRAEQLGIPMDAETVSDALKALRGRSTGGRSPHAGIFFGSVRKPEGLGLPPEFVEKNPHRAIERYARRFALDRAFYDHMEKDEYARAAMALRDPLTGYVYSSKDYLPDGEPITDISGSEDIKNFLDYLTKNVSNIDFVTGGFETAAISAMLGPVSAAADVASTVPIMTSYMIHPSEAKDVAKAFAAAKADWDAAWEEPFKKGFSRAGAPTRRAVRNMSEIVKNLNTEGANTISDVSEVLYNASRFLNKIQGREDLDKLSHFLSWTYARGMVGGRISRAYTGDEGAIKSLVELTEGLATPYLKAGKALPQEVVDMATFNLASKAQPQYQPGTLPPWLNETSLIGHLGKLSRWSAIQFNQFVADKVAPAVREGNVMPLMLSAATALGGGYAIQGLREMMNKRTPVTPTFDELAAGSETGMKDYAAKIAGILSASGAFGGIATDIISKMLDASVGGNLQGYGIPILEMASKLAVDVTDAWNAVVNGDVEFVDGMTELLKLQATGFSQLARVIERQTLGTLREDEKQQKLARDYSIYKRLNIPGNRSPKNIGSRINPFEGYYNKKFKQARTVEDAAEYVPTLTSQILRQRTPERMERKLEGLGSIPVRFVPSPDTSPEEFKSYMLYVRKTQGEEAMKNLLREYIKAKRLAGQKKTLLRETIRPQLDQLDQ